ncbi:hypothetical protein UCRPA7_4989 [Phaeoacremonium minimum UCRPA7]|uniref:Uncharacterized protein n=1 Tax=Phaeoacremonium minimum (strain UCR-PA7) TaxID=1286976 RepID=R8BJH9_PHAM7|nr:hypothetical protein UCRPA7_4989 [Phaeoacremonium minimum UCRPA7]EON99503.1 hypothetical protein UCRPA7_4989 [Phaeoacremonium minimum UCRPA7]
MVFQHKKEQLAKAELVSVSATTDDPSFTTGNMPGVTGVSIDTTFRLMDLPEHFKARGVKFTVDSATTADNAASDGNDENAKLLLKIITDIKRNKAPYNSLEELKDIVQTHLARRDYSPTVNTPDT